MQDFEMQQLVTVVISEAGLWCPGSGLHSGLNDVHNMHSFQLYLHISLHNILQDITA